MSKEVWTKAPLRIGISGGATDLPAYSNSFGGSVINATINKFVHVRIKHSHDESCHFVSHDLDYSEHFEVNKIPEKPTIFSATYLRLSKIANKFSALSVESFCDSPMGSGLGTSSTFCVALVSGIAEFYGIDLGKQEIANLAFTIEREDCNFSGGKQDQFAATYGGINKFIFNPDGSTEVSQLNLDQNFIMELESQLVLHFSGVSRDSSTVISDQEKSASGPTKSETLDSLHKIKSEVSIVEKAFDESDFTAFAASLDRTWFHKKSSSKLVSNENIDTIIKSGINSGAVSAKVSGAGGGGFILFAVPFSSRGSLFRELAKHDGFSQSITFVHDGVLSWRGNIG